MARKATPSSGPEAGWAALDDGRWDDARTAFAAALEVEERPESLEGLSWAAWWQDDESTVFAARERAFRLYRSRGDVASAARMATWLAADQLDFHGATAVASGWLRRARRLLAGLEPRPDHGWLDFHEGYLAYVRGDTDRSLELARRAAELGRRLEVTDLAILGLALHGAVLVTCAEVDRGMDCLDEAAAAALGGEVEIPISRAWACCFLVTACEAVRDYERAFEWCDRIAEFADRYGGRYMLGFCRQHYGAVHVWRGEWAEAEAQLEAAVDAYSLSRPAFARGPLAALAELRRRQGRWEDAERLLDRVGAGSALVCRAWLALDRGASRRAVELAQRALRQTDGARSLLRVPALEVLVAAHVARAELEEARAALPELEDLARIGGTRPLRAAAALAGGMVATAGGDHEHARRLLEDAVDAFERSGAPFDAARARIELAACLIALRRDDDAAREVEASVETLARLGAEAEARRARRLLDKPAPDRQAETLGEITRREREVLRLLAEGLTNREMADRLFVSQHTIHRHVANILRKLDLTNRTAAAAHAIRAGLLDSSSE
jgi:ATP/maltotriose-dependent transcriptional regulator MalT